MRKTYLSKTAMKQEALNRMRLLGFPDKAIFDFLYENKIYCSKENNGKLQRLEPFDEKVVKFYEKKSKNIVYHLIKLTEQLPTFRTNLLNLIC